MIHYLVTADHAYTIEWFLETWRPALAPRINVLSYEEVPDIVSLPPGTYVFSDIERLTPAGRGMAAEAWDRVTAGGNQALNNPHHVMDRFDLLQTLHARGESRFQIYRVSETYRPERFPVFLRPDREHEIFGGLLHDQIELDDAIAQTMACGWMPADLLMVEFLDTSDQQGYFRKYATHLFGDRLLPGWFNLGQEWSLRYERLDGELETQKWNETWQYARENPHADWVRRMARIAGIEYGRVDYGLLNGEPQLWEINTNPTLLYHRDTMAAIEMPFSEYFADAVQSALESLDTESSAAARWWRRGVTYATKGVRW